MKFLEKPIAGLLSLKAQLIFIMGVATLCGLLIGTSWYQSRLMWNEYLGNAFSAGVSLSEHFNAINTQTLDEQSIFNIPNFTVSSVLPTKITSADNSVSLRFADLPAAYIVTSLSLLVDQGNSAFEGERLGVRIFSPNKRYELRTIENTGGIGLASRLGVLVKTLASECGASTLFLQASANYWLRIEGADIWGCKATPADLRLPALLFSIVILIIATYFAINRAEILERLAVRIKHAAINGQYQPLPLKGPTEIRQLTHAVNTLFTHERERLEQRATLLSGVSHDLGTPATRLKLRAALISDIDLRQKLNKDIDHMTQMIDGVLTYARGEISDEARRSVSMVALVQSLVDDYADMGQPVSLASIKDIVLTRASSIFTTREKHPELLLSSQTLLVCDCRPNQIRRALSNLVDNALKYGKSATLSLKADAQEISICVCDEGGMIEPINIEAYIGAFKRGENATIHKGVGLGLTIVTSIARSHGGRVGFESFENGSKISLVLPRS